jgi:aerobic C4-dicarboxylate transport protein
MTIPRKTGSEGAGMAGVASRGRFGILGKLWLQVLVGMLAGVLLGHYAPDVGASMKPLGDAFIALIRMLIGPVIFCTVVHGIARMNDMARVGRVALKAIVYFELVTTVALVFALVGVNLVKPGAGMNIDPHALDAKAVAGYVATAHQQSVQDYLLHIIPTTFVSAFTASEVLPVLFVSVLFAFALALAGDAGKPVLAVVESASQVFFRMVGLVMWAAPLGAFGALAFTVGKFGWGSLVQLGALIGEFYAVSALFVAIVFGLIARSVGVSLWRLMGFIREELLVTAATTSSETVLPALMKKLEAAGCEESVVGLVVPTGYSFNLDGTCLYLATASVFLAQATNTPLALPAQIGLVLVLLLTSKGAAGVAGAAFVVLAGTLGAVGHVPVTSVALVLGIHRLMAEALTFVNVVGNALAAIVVSKSEHAVDLDRLQATVGIRRPLPPAAPAR